MDAEQKAWNQTVSVSESPALARLDHRRLVVGAMLISTFMAAVEVTVISTAMPTIVGQLGGFALFSWAFGIYVLAQAVATPLYGRLADGYGRKTVYIGSVALFLLGSLLCGLAWSMPALILFRAIQGIGGGGLIPMATTIIGDIAPASDRPRLMGYVNGVWGVSAITGPLIGAFCVRSLGWPFVFWLNLPIGLVTATMVARFLREPARVARPAPIDLPGAAQLTLGIGVIMVSLVEFETLTWAEIGAYLLIGVLALTSFIRRERHAVAPLLPTHLWRRPIIRAADASAVLCGGLMLGMTAFLPTWVQGVMGGSALISGVAIGALTMSWTLANIAAGRVFMRVRYRSVAVAASCLLLVGTIGLLLLSPSGGLGRLLVACVPLGMGLGLNSLVFTVSVQSAVAHEDRGRAIAQFYFSRLIGQALGSAAFGGVLNAGLGEAGAHHLVQDLVDTARRATLPVEALDHMAGILATALHGVFGLASAVAAGVLLVALLVPREARLEEG